MGDGLSSSMRCVFKRLRASSSSKNNDTSSNSNSSSSSTTTPTSSTSNNIETTTNKSQKTLDIDKQRQYSGWDQNERRLPTNFHHPSKQCYNGNYISNPMAMVGSHHKKEKESTVPISICIMILICYITSGAVLFHELQKWSVLESLYFCFTALSTIGFGDLQPKDEIGMYVASVYIIVGMAIVAMCFSLIQTELIIWLRKFAVQSIDDEVTLVNVATTPIKS